MSEDKINDKWDEILWKYPLKRWLIENLRNAELDQLGKRKSEARKK